LPYIIIPMSIADFVTEYLFRVMVPPDSSTSSVNEELLVRVPICACPDLEQGTVGVYSVFDVKTLNGGIRFKLLFIALAKG
jgi:hypothetical protein